MNKQHLNLFTATEHWTEEANQLAFEIGAKIRPIIEKYIAAGYRTRDIESVIINEVSINMGSYRLDLNDLKESR